MGINKDGSISHLAEKKDVSVLYDWYQIEREKYPQNSILIFASSWHHFPYPTSLYGLGAWAAVDLLYFLPELPMTFIGEELGWVKNPDITQGKFVSPNIYKTWNLNQIKGHYDHRVQLRKKYAVLREGGMIPLFAYYATSFWHNRVFAFARFTKSDSPEISIVAVNFNDVPSIFFIDYTPLRRICETGDIIYKIEDLITSGNAQYYSPEEFFQSKAFVQLPAYGSFCWGVFVQEHSLEAERLLFEQSMERLERNLHNNVDPSHTLIYSMIHTSFILLQITLSKLCKPLLTKKFLKLKKLFLVCCNKFFILNPTKKKILLLNI